jgi:hypothetical protein
MKRVLMTAAILAVSAGWLCAAAPEGAVYGEGVTLEESIEIQTLLGDPDPWLGKRVRVDGVVSAVCQHRGCWMQIKDPDSERAIRIKVEDGVIVFPTSAIGKDAAAEGIFEAVPVKTTASSPHHHHKHGEGEAHHAECAGEAVEDRVLLIRGTGAIVFGEPRS